MQNIKIKDEFLAKDIRAIGNLTEKKDKGELSETDFGFEMMILMIEEVDGNKDRSFIQDYVDNLNMDEFTKLSEKVFKKMKELEENNKKKSKIHSTNGK